MGHEPTELPRVLRREEIRRKALTAASSVVLAFSLGACVTKDPVEESDPDTATVDIPGDDGGTDGGGTDGGGTDDGGTDDGGTDDGGTDDGGTDDGGTDDGGSDDGGSDDGGSDDGDDTGTIDTGMAAAPDCTSVPSDEVALCCSELAEWCTELYDDFGDEFNDCLYGPDFDGSTGCSPWGPPVPPRARVA